VDHSAGLGVVSGALFLESSRVHPTLLMAYERLPRMCTATGSIRGAYMNWRGNHMCCVYQVFPYRVYIDSNRSDSRI
jgi:hypothetical protein